MRRKNLRAGVAVAAICLFTAASAVQAAPTSVAIRADPVLPLDALREPLSAALKDDAAVTLGAIATTEVGAEATATAATRPAATEGIVAFVIPAPPIDQRPAMRIVVVDPTLGLRLNVESTLIRDDDLPLLAETIAGAIRRGVAKLGEPVESIVAVGPVRVGGLDAATVQRAALAGEWLEHELLARSGVFVLETELLRRLAPPPGLGDRPAPSRVDALASASISSTPAAGGAEVRLTVADRVGVRRTATAVLDAPGPAVARLRALALEIPIASAAAVAPTSAPATNAATSVPADAAPASLADLARFAFEAGADDAATGLFEAAVAEAPGDVALRRAAVVAYSRAVSRATNHDLRRNETDALAGLDRRAALYFRLLAHFKALLDASPKLMLTNSELRFVGAALRSIDNFAWNGDMRKESPEKARSKEYLLLSAAVFESWSLDCLRAGRDDDAWVMAEASTRIERATGSKQAAWDRLAEWFEAHKDEPRLPKRVFAYGSPMGNHNPAGSPEGLAFLERVAKLGPAFAASLEPARKQAEARAKQAKPTEDYFTALRTARETPIAADATPEVTFAPIELPYRGILAAGEIDVAWVGGLLVAIRADGSTHELAKMTALNDTFEQAVFDGRYVWAPVRRLREYATEPAVVVVDTRTLAVRILGRADGLPAMNADSDDRQRGWSPAGVAAVAPGRCVLVGTDERAWVASLSVTDDAQMTPKVEVLLRTDAEPNPADKEQWRSPRVNFIPGGALPIGPAGAATHVFIFRGDVQQPLVLSLADRTFAACQTPVDTGPDACAAAAGDVYWLRSWNITDPTAPAGSRNTQILRRYDVATRRFVDVLNPAAVTVGQDARLTEAMGRLWILGTRAFVADDTTGPFRPLGGLPPRDDQHPQRPRIGTSIRLGLVTWYGSQNGGTPLRVTLAPTTQPAATP